MHTDLRPWPGSDTSSQHEAGVMTRPTHHHAREKLQDPMTDAIAGARPVARVSTQHGDIGPRHHRRAGVRNLPPPTHRASDPTGAPAPPFRRGLATSAPIPATGQGHASARPGRAEDVRRRWDGDSCVPVLPHIDAGCHPVNGGQDWMSLLPTPPAPGTARAAANPKERTTRCQTAPH